MFNKIINFFKRLFGYKKEETILECSVKYFKSPVKILLDNGHGENTLGKRSPFSNSGVLPNIEFYEYAWNREIARMVYDKLISLNYDVELLVPEIKDISLSERVARVNKQCDKLGKNNVLLVSIHANAAGDGSQWENGRGWEAYTSVGKTNSDYVAAYFYNNAESIFKGKKIRYDWLDGDSDKEVNFYILKYTKCPAILTENFFYDNIDDVKFILSDEGKEKIVELHVKSIIEYLSDEDKTY